MAAAMPQYLWLFVCVSVGGNGGTGADVKIAVDVAGTLRDSNQTPLPQCVLASLGFGFGTGASMGGGKEGAAVGGTRSPPADRRRHEAVKRHQFPCAPTAAPALALRGRCATRYATLDSVPCAWGAGTGTASGRSPPSYPGSDRASTKGGGRVESVVPFF